MDSSLAAYTEKLYLADNLNDAFDAFDQEAKRLGYESVLYTHIPKALIESEFVAPPVYKVSQDFNPGYLAHYEQARFDRYDPLIRAVDAGERQMLDWWGATCKHYTNGESESSEVIATSRAYGIQSGITIPLMSGKSGIAGASFINSESGSKEGINNPNIEQLALSTRLFHSLVVANPEYKGEFLRTLLNRLSRTEKLFLARLARGRSPSEIAYELRTSERYLEQVMLKMRRRFSGVSPTESPTINRNQLLYYAGLLDILEYVD